jgi:Ca-activated chloride channel family protein
MTAAYKYVDPDRPLNVVVVSDGMTEQTERAQLLRLIGSKPANARVFCIGVGNEINRPLLRQVAEDAGGLAAFISRGDSFERQASAFRRKLMRPAATDIVLRFDGGDVYDVIPGQLPNLYHGSPVRAYGRYRRNGPVEVILSANVMGRKFTKSAEVQMPAKDSGNPEMERMWAWHRIQGLLRKADRAGGRSSVIPEIVRLGEGYSIASEYTSFLVLENDAEYKRWKIERRNALRIERDRAKQRRLRTRLDSMRDEATARLGPQPAESAPEPVAQAPRTAPRVSSTPARQAPRNTGGSRSSGSGFSFGFSGAIDPITGTFGLGLAAAAAWVLRGNRTGRKDGGKRRWHR